MNSLDPRVNRLPSPIENSSAERKRPLDQFGTYEVFVRPKEGKPFQHEGAVHAPNLEMAFILAKETFTRRFSCISLCVVDTHNVFISPTTEDGQNAFDHLPSDSERRGEEKSYELYVLPKRGKQHLHWGTVPGTSPTEAMAAGKALNAGKVVYNIWAIPTSDFRFTEEAELDIWITLPEKRFRDAADYKGGEKLKEFLDRNKKVAV
jgi:ring-1,2-phenylacetyl-CoA epoxidase subunit PaaB